MNDATQATVVFELREMQVFRCFSTPIGARQEASPYARFVQEDTQPSVFTIWLDTQNSVQVLTDPLCSATETRPNI